MAPEARGTGSLTAAPDQDEMDRRRHDVGQRMERHRRRARLTFSILLVTQMATMVAAAVISGWSSWLAAVSILSFFGWLFLMVSGTT